MKKNCRRTVLTISNSRWLAYATAGAASALVGTPHAEAEIHYSGQIHATIEGSGAHVQLPLSHRISLFFDEFTSGGPSFYSSAFFLIKGRGVVSGGARAYQTNTRTQLLSNLQSGSPISSGKFGSVAGQPGIGELKGAYWTGRFLDDGRGIIGFKFNSGAGTQYGWVRVKVSHFKGFKYRYVIEDYAWGDVGDSIKAGQKRSQQDTTTAESVSGSLGVLACGGAGLEAWRNERARAGASRQGH
ncbi:MAG: hypothetical protein ACREIF_12490 [Chthoniobacterales bacterium]